MNFAGLIFLLIAHYICGRGVLRLFRMELAPVATFCLAMMIGVPVVAFAPCLLQLLHIPIEAKWVIASIAVITGLPAIPLLLKLKRPRIGRPRLPQLYELPFIIVLLLLVVISVWRCFYYPVYARDMLSGPELIAEYAVREKTLINSVFSIDLQTTNNHFKSPYITTLQVIYKLLVSSFGSLWVSVLFLSFTVWLYSLLRQRIHPVLAGFLLFLFTAIPELYAYTYMVLYDYSNMVFFFCGFYFLIKYTESYQTNQLFFSAFLFGLATYIRTETVVLVAMTTPLLFVFMHRNKMKLKDSVMKLAIFMAFPVFFYFLCIHVFVRLFVPVPFDLGGQVNPHLGDVSGFFHRLWDVQAALIVSARGVRLYGYFILFFYAVLLTDIAWQRKFNRESVIALYGILVVLVGLPLLGHLLPLVDLQNTTKRGLFKMFPLILLYLANSSTLQSLSGLIVKWEYMVKVKK